MPRETGFSSELSLQVNEAMFREINSLLYPDTGSTKKVETEKKDSSRKSSHRREHSKRDSGSSKTRKSKIKSKVTFDVSVPPVCNFNITQDEMVALISRAANFTKKQLAKLTKLSNLPQNKPNSDL